MDSLESFATIPVPGNPVQEQRNYDIKHEDLLSIHTTLTEIFGRRHQTMTNDSRLACTRRWPPPTRYVRNNISPHRSPAGPQPGPHYKKQNPQGPQDIDGAN